MLGLKHTEAQAEVVFSGNFEEKIKYLHQIDRELMTVKTNANLAFNQKDLKEYMSDLVNEEKLLEAFKLLQYCLKARLKHNAVMILYYSYYNNESGLSDEIENFKYFGAEMISFYEDLEKKNKSKIQLEFNGKGETQIHLAARHGNSMDVEFFVRIFGDKANPERKKKSRLFGGSAELQRLTFMTPLHEALQNEHHECVELLTKDFPSSISEDLKEISKLQKKVYTKSNYFNHLELSELSI